jgi:hypothetical protein
VKEILYDGRRAQRERSGIEREERIGCEEKEQGKFVATDSREVCT